jgi:hypothetical protein
MALQHTQLLYLQVIYSNHPGVQFSLYVWQASPSLRCAAARARQRCVKLQEKISQHLPLSPSSATRVCVMGTGSCRGAASDLSKSDLSIAGRTAPIQSAPTAGPESSPSVRCKLCPCFATCLTHPSTCNRCSCANVDTPSPAAGTASQALGYHQHDTSAFTCPPSQPVSACFCHLI